MSLSSERRTFVKPNGQQVVRRLRQPIQRQRHPTLLLARSPDGAQPQGDHGTGLQVEGGGSPCRLNWSLKNDFVSQKLTLNIGGLLLSVDTKT